jgi:hypothetical protein
MDSGPNYTRAVLRCISGIDAVYTLLQGEKFRDEVEVKILCPLEENLKILLR